MSMPLENPYATPVYMAPEADRVSYLRKVALLTLGSLTLVGITASLSAVLILGLATAGIMVPWFLQLILMLGGLYGAQFLGNRMTSSPSAGTRVAGLVLGSGMLGVSLGFLLLAAVFVSAGAFEGALALFVLPFQALGLVGLTVAGMVVYLLTGPRKLSMVTGAVAMLTLPMLGLMAITWIWPVGGVMGIVISAVFVVISAAGLLVSLNRVIHKLGVDQAMLGAFQLTVGIVVLFWNILSLLMRITDR